MPPRRYERNLLVANWALRKFAAHTSDRQLPEALFHMAQVITAFDLVALQEVDRNLARLEALLDILGPDCSFLVTDAPGNWGNNERFAILYYTPRVEFRHFSSKLVLPPERGAGGEQWAAEQLARPCVELHPFFARLVALVGTVMVASPLYSKLLYAFPT